MRNGDPLDRLALRALATKASAGPWLIERRDMGGGEIVYVIYGAHDADCDRCLACGVEAVMRPKEC